MMLNCRQAARLIAHSLERPLSRWERFRLRLHLLLCRLCRRYEKQLTWIDQVTAHVVTQSMEGHAMPENTRERIRRTVIGEADGKGD